VVVAFQAQRLSVEIRVPLPCPLFPSGNGGFPLYQVMRRPCVGDNASKPILPRARIRTVCARSFVPWKSRERLRPQPEISPQIVDIQQQVFETFFMDDHPQDVNFAQIFAVAPRTPAMHKAGQRPGRGRNGLTQRITSAFAQTMVPFMAHQMVGLPIVKLVEKAPNVLGHFGQCTGPIRIEVHQNV